MVIYESFLSLAVSEARIGKDLIIHFYIPSLLVRALTHTEESLVADEFINHCVGAVV